MIPVGERSNPARHRSKVVLPHPDGPNTAVIPLAGRVVFTLRLNEGKVTSKLAVNWLMRRGWASVD